MWTPATRRRHSREHLRYASDVSDEEWALLEPHLPAPCLTGRPRAWPMREIVNAIFYVLRSGCAWRLLPDSFPPRQTVYGWFLRLRDDCVSGAAEPPSGHARPRAGFAVQPRRWVVERFFAWIGRNRRLAKDFEATLESARAFLYAASIMLLTRRLAQSG